MKALSLSLVLLLCISLMGQELRAAAKPARPSKKPRPHYTATPIPAPPGLEFFDPVRINDRGTVLGNAYELIGELYEVRAVLHQKGVTVNLHALIPDQTISFSYGLDLNDRNEALISPNERFYPTFLYSKGRLIDTINLIGEPDLQPVAINSRGQIVGHRWISHQWGEAFLYQNGRFQLLPGLTGFPYSFGLRISNSGIILGLAEGPDDGDEMDRSFVFTKDLTIDLGPVFGLDLNNAGHVVTGHNTSAEVTGSLWQEGTFTEIPLNPAALNDHDQVVGRIGPHPHRAALHYNGTTWDLNDLIDPAANWVLLEAKDINNDGQIVAIGLVHDQWTGFLLTPTVKKAHKSRRPPSPSPRGRYPFP